MEPQTTVAKLQILLPHWIEHNLSHASEFSRWAAAARAEGSPGLAALLEQAAANMAATDALLKEAAAETGAAGHAHSHDHGAGADHRH
ncbi:MAG: hypothetical protein WCI17_03880 [bacterium]